MKTERPLWNPYVAGVALGLVVLLSFVVLGFGVGASGSANRTGIFITHAVAPEAIEGNAYMGKYVNGEKHILDDWLIFEVIGVLLGGIVAAFSAGRFKRTVQAGPKISVNKRLLWALAGGVIAGVGARIAYGCTSGQGLTGGAMLSVASWAFMGTFFLGAYLAAPLFKRQWL